MPTPPVPNTERARRKAVIEDLLKQGYHPQGSTGGIASATKEAERREGVNFPRWVRWEEAQRDAGLPHYAIDWSLFTPIATTKHTVVAEAKDVVFDQPTEEALWSDLSLEGWIRQEAVDVISEVTKTTRSGEEVTTPIKIYDPGIQYPPSWNGPLLSEERPVEPRGADGVRRWVVTGVQDKTPLHGPFAVNLEAFAAYMGAEIIYLGATYNRDLWTQLFGNDVDRKSTNAEVASYPSHIRSKVIMTRKEVAGIRICGEVNIIPTAERPLSGLLTYGKSHSTIFAHPKQELESVPRAPHLDPVLCWTTGYCTPPNYVQRKAGLKAAFHHVIGAVMVEQDVDGTVFTRHLHADPDSGAFQDLDVKVEEGVVTSGNRVRAITYGDIHAEHLDPDVAYGTWMSDDALQTVLKPEHVFIHDVLDFFSRNHHNRNDPWHAVEVMKRGLTVAQEIRKVSYFLGQIRQEGTQIHVVESNHDLALARWVRENDWRTDVLNAPLQLELALMQANAILENRDVSMFEYAVRKMAEDGLPEIDFLREDESFLVDGVECGWHGHNGPNGSRGTTQGYLKVATKMNKGHDHTPTKRQGVSSAGTKQRINPMPRWAKGPTSWAHCDVVQYDGGRTSHIIFSGSRWKAVGNNVAMKAAA